MGTAGKGKRKTKVTVKGQRPSRAATSSTPTKAQAALARRPRVAADY